MTSAEPDAPNLPWQDPAFLADAGAWVDERLAAAGLSRTGEIEQPHAFWWSTALRIPTAAGPLWFKATQPEGAFESRLTPLLAARWPDRIVDVLAADPVRGWTLARDAGTKLRELDDGTSPVDHWERLLPRYAEIQIGLADGTDELLGTGVPDLRLATLPAQLEALLDEPEMLVAGADGGIDDERRAHLLRALPAFRDACRRLAEAGVPETIQHDDLNDGNAFVREGQHVVFDWGDACVSHPFHSLVVALRSLAYRHRWEPGGPEVTRLRDAYLEAWNAFGSRADLVEVAELARRTGTIQRSLAWRRSVLRMPDGVRAAYVESVPYGLRLYLLDGPWGTWDDGSF